MERRRLAGSLFCKVFEGNGRAGGTPALRQLCKQRHFRVSGGDEGRFRESRMGWLKRIALGLGVVLVLIVLALAGLIVSDRLAQPPAADARILLAKAARYHARIRAGRFRRAAYHRPPPTPTSPSALASRTPRTISPPSRTSRWPPAARWRRPSGPKAAITDYLVHLLRVWETVNARYDADLPADVRRVLEAYADGVNYYAALHPDQVARRTAAVDGQGHRRRLCLQVTVLLRPRRRAAKRSPRHPTAGRRAAGRLEWRGRRAVALRGRRHPPAGQFASALYRPGRLVRGGAGERRRLACGRRLLSGLAVHAARPQCASGLGEHGQRARPGRCLPADAQPGESQPVSARRPVARLREERRGDPGEALGPALLDASIATRPVVRAWPGAEDRSRRLRHPLSPA